jgi:histidinol-phosphate phosphatase family protein
MAVRYELVVPTVGRASLRDLLTSLQDGVGPRPSRVVLVHDVAEGHPADLDRLTSGFDLAPLMVVRSGGRGPATARNHGWRQVRSPWVVFVDDDVVPTAGWRADLADDLGATSPSVAGVQGRIVVPLPADRPPTDWERNVAGLERARWATADMAYRREALAAVGGVGECFRRAYREDADLALRVMAAGGDLAVGRRVVTHPVRPAPWWVSVAKQAGNADDPLMARRHGRAWRSRAEAPVGRRRRHTAITAAGLAAVLGMATGRRRLTAAAGTAWALGTAELARARIAPGPRSVGEVTAMLATSVAIPPAAVGWWLAGWARARRIEPEAGGTDRPDAVLFDRDGTLVDDVPYNGDPAEVRLRPGAREALAGLRAEGIAVGLVTNQSGVAAGRITDAQVHSVNTRLSELIGPFDTVVVCSHGPAERCRCRKPAPGMVIDAAQRLGTIPERCVVVGDIGSDVGAALAAGARAVLVPTAATRPEEVAAAPMVATDLHHAVELILGGRRADR